ncbi:unnamed protein product [Caenorhabditis brenneri]
MERNRRRREDAGLMTKSLVGIASVTFLVAWICSSYEITFTHVISTIDVILEESEYYKSTKQWMASSLDATWHEVSIPSRKAEHIQAINPEVDVAAGGKHVFTPEQLHFFDGTRDSKPCYLAILGRVYNVDGKKEYYGPGKSYHHFAGRDATRAFTTGDFTENGLVATTHGLSHDELLSIRDWVSFYEKEYPLVGVVADLYYDSEGQPTAELTDVLARVEKANEYRKAQAVEIEVFPPCNSEYNSNGGRVWCSTKSGGVERQWAGVPRKLIEPTTKKYRCACVKNFGPGVSGAEEVKSSSNRGDLDHPDLELFPDCSPTSNSCKIVS